MPTGAKFVELLLYLPIAFHADQHPLHVLQIANDLNSRRRQSLDQCRGGDDRIFVSFLRVIEDVQYIERVIVTMGLLQQRPKPIDLGSRRGRVAADIEA